MSAESILFSSADESSKSNPERPTPNLISELDFNPPKPLLGPTADRVARVVDVESEGEYDLWLVCEAKGGTCWEGKRLRGERREKVMISSPPNVTPFTGFCNVVLFPLGLSSALALLLTLPLPLA
eukprot:378509-Amorphochlora_amoeboformis.AAC.2